MTSHVPLCIKILSQKPLTQSEVSSQIKKFYFSTRDEDIFTDETLNRLEKLTSVLTKEQIEPSLKKRKREEEKRNQDLLKEMKGEKREKLDRWHMQSQRNV